MTAPTVTPLAPKPGGRTKDRKPTIRATVRDDSSELTAQNIELSTGWGNLPFQYNQATDTLSATSDRLAYGVNTAEISVVDGEGNMTVRTWSFKVIR